MLDHCTQYMNFPSITEHPGTCRQGRQCRVGLRKCNFEKLLAYRLLSEVLSASGAIRQLPNFYGRGPRICGVRCLLWLWGAKVKKNMGDILVCFTPKSTWLKKARGALCIQGKHGGMFFFLRSLPFSLFRIR